ncbi:MAG: RDD family protein [Candidatus Limnocylindria bacterium]
MLTAGAKRAERVAHAAGVDRALNQAVEEALVRALRSPAVIRAIERTIDDQRLTQQPDGDEIAQLVKRALETDAADRTWREFLESEQAQMLVERIAGAPEIRAAIASQSAGLITDIGVRLTIITEELDDALERITRRRDPDSETDQAGLATRAVAGAIDLGLLCAGYALISGVLASLVSAVFGQPLSVAAVIVLAALGLLVGGGIFAAFWALAGQTPGMRFLAIRLTRADGSREITFGRGLRRVLAVIMSLLPLGLGYLAILRDPRRRAWADRWTRTEVIYDPVARAAPHSGVSPASAAAARHRPRNA